MSAFTRVSGPAASRRCRPLPEMRVNTYDRVSSFLLATVLALTLTVVAVLCWWHGLRPAPIQSVVPVKFVPGGFDDGSPDESFLVESPDEQVPNAAPGPDPAEELEPQDVLTAVVELSERAAEQAQQVLDQAGTAGGLPGSIPGTGRPLGADRGPRAGVPREQRWFVKFADEDSLDEYARQLDSFGIELGIVYPQRSELVYVAGLSRPNPERRVVHTGQGESRLYMTWLGGRRKAADLTLLTKAGLDPAGGIVLHFYPPETESLLADAERNFASRSEGDIRRTYFVIVRRGAGYGFAVTRQTYWK